MDFCLIYWGRRYLQVFIKADYSSWGKSQWQEVGEGEPEPELCEDQQANHWGHVSVTRPGLQRDGHITATCTLRELLVKNSHVVFNLPAN